MGKLAMSEGDLDFLVPTYGEGMIRIPKHVREWFNIGDGDLIRVRILKVVKKKSDQ